MKIYMSIPITGHDIELQKARAAEIADHIITLGHIPVDPFDTPEPPDTLGDRARYAYFMGEDLKRLLTCDAIYLDDGWQKSKGCILERTAGILYDLKSYVTLADIPANSDPQ